ncbi:hypothetical protein [Solibacillus sp. NPDC093137]|uniref:hypothetical protein n=1 Tax=Solibacillus sp. NPDC093137 TaxID=3390678 RepID=UPI003D007FC6
MNEDFSSAAVTSSDIDYTERLDTIIFYLEVVSGGVIELGWIAKTFLIFYIIFGAWRVVRK